jgi:hypothetical protein
MAVVEYQDLPLAGKDRRWDGDAAEKRVRAWVRAEDKPNERYRKAFLWYDETAPDNFGSYKFPIADVIRGQLKVVPRGIIAAAAVIDGHAGCYGEISDSRRRRAVLTAIHKELVDGSTAEKLSIGRL